MDPPPPRVPDDEDGAGHRPGKLAIASSALRPILYVLLAFALMPVMYYICFDTPPKFSLQLTGVQGLDTAATAAPLSTVFNMTLHADNKRGGTASYQNGEAVVRYAGFTLAWGRTRAFRLRAGRTLDVPVVALADGGGLPEPVRDRLATEQSAGGVVELEVHVKLFADEDWLSSGAEPTWMWCKVATTGRGETLSSSDVTPCSVFGSNIWASDFAPNWMLV